MNYRRTVVIKDRATGQEIGSIVRDDNDDFHIQEQGTLYPMEALPDVIQRLIVAIGEVFEHERTLTKANGEPLNPNPELQASDRAGRTLG